jgi:hypothetical protein
MQTAVGGGVDELEVHHTMPSLSDNMWLSTQASVRNMAVCIQHHGIGADCHGTTVAQLNYGLVQDCSRLHSQ